jgi:hypothetical protein
MKERVTRRLTANSWCLANIWCLAAFFVTTLLTTALPDGVHTPPSGSAERKAILDALRVPVQRRVGQKVIFVVNHLRVQNGWAFFAGSARNSKGKTLGDKYLWGETSALLRKSSGRWRVLQWGFATDTSVMEECRNKYPNAPRAIFP